MIPYRANTQRSARFEMFNATGLKPNHRPRKSFEYIRICSGIFNSNLLFSKVIDYFVYSRRKRFGRSFLKFYQCTITKNDLVCLLVALNISKYTQCARVSAQYGIGRTFLWKYSRNKRDRNEMHVASVDRHTPRL